MAKKVTKRKRERQKQAKIRLCIGIFIVFLVGIFPLIALIPCVLEIIPTIVLGIYTSIAYLITGTLFIIFTVLEKYGFGEEGYGFNRFTGLRWLTKKEAKANHGVFGGFMIAIGVFFAVLTAIYC